jgi:hypothetical protein
VLQVSKKNENRLANRTPRQQRKHRSYRSSRNWWASLKSEFTYNRPFILLIVVTSALASFLMVYASQSGQSSSLITGKKVMNLQERVISDFKKNGLTESEKAIINSFTESEINQIKKQIDIK